MSQYQNSSRVSWKTKIGRFRGIKTPRLHRVLTEMQGSDSSNSWNSKTVFLFFLSAILKTSRVYPVALCRPGDCARRAMAVHILSLPEQEPPSIAASARSSLSGPPRNLDFVEGTYGSNANDDNQKTGTSFWNVYQKMQARMRNDWNKDDDFIQIPNFRSRLKSSHESIWVNLSQSLHRCNSHLHLLIARHSMRCCWKPMKQSFQGRFLNSKNYLWSATAEVKSFFVHVFLQYCTLFFSSVTCPCWHLRLWSFSFAKTSRYTKLQEDSGSPASPTGPPVFEATCFKGNKHEQTYESSMTNDMFIISDK